MGKRVNEVTQEVLRTIDTAGLAAIAARTKNSGPASSSKYLDVGRWIRTNVERALSLGLDTSGPRRILDIGTGYGYFPYVCRTLGHDVVAIDRTKRPRQYREVTELLKVHVLDVDIEPRKSLQVPLMVHSFDVITAHMVTFNGHATDALWGVREWDYFLDDLYVRLAVGGSIAFELNNEPPDFTNCYTDVLRAFFESRGARIDGHRLLFQRD